MTKYAYFSFGWLKHLIIHGQWKSKIHVTVCSVPGLYKAQKPTIIKATMLSMFVSLTPHFNDE